MLLLIKEFPESLGDMGSGTTHVNGLKVFPPITVSEGGVHLCDALEVLSLGGCHGSRWKNAQKVLHFVDPLIVRAALAK